MEDNIATLDAKIIEQRNQIVALSNENDDIKMKGGELSQVNFDVLNSQLNIAHAEIKQKDLQISQLAADLKRTKDALLDFHQ